MRRRVDADECRRRPSCGWQTRCRETCHRDIQPKSEQSILIEGERIKAVSGSFIDPPPGGELIDLRKKFVLPGLIGCHVHLTAQLDQGLPPAASPANPDGRGRSRQVSRSCVGSWSPLALRVAA